MVAPCSATSPSASAARATRDRRARSLTCSRSLPISPELSRNRPVGTTNTREPGALAPRALPHLPAEPRRRTRRPARGLPVKLARWPATTTSVRSTGHPSLRPRSSGSSWPSNAPPRCPHRDGSAAGVDRRAAAPGDLGDRARATCSIAWSWRPSCGSRSSATSPEACVSAGSTSRASMRDRSSVLARVGPEIEAIAGLPAGTSAVRASMLWPAFPSASCPSSGDDSRTGCPRPSRCLPSPSSGITTSTPSPRWARPRSTGDPFATADCTLDGRYSHLVSTIANHDELTPDSEFTADPTAQVESRRRVEGVADPTCTGQRRPPR